ncbi:MAG: DUF4922 domain-containing protein [Parabacteroides sp.]|nr:DUF4922 domain-containing protein [Parabacteroides sp.]
MNDLEQQIELLLLSQKRDWKLAHDNYASLAYVQTRCFEGDSRLTILQFNPERIRSSAAKIDKASLEARPCFFCHRPEEQKSVVYNDAFEILVNPYPIFNDHLTVPLRRHEKQQIAPYYGDMLDLASDLPGYALFYNGPKCGASAPDHMHFQAGRRGGFPVIQSWAVASKAIVREGERTCLYALVDHLPTAFILVSDDKAEAEEVFTLLYDRMTVKPGDYEPMMNVLVWTEGDSLITCVFPRRELRPSCYYAEGDDNILISPATVEMSGLFVVPLEKDFRKVTYADLEQVWREVSLTEAEKNEIIRKIREKV